MYQKKKSLLAQLLCSLMLVPLSSFALEKGQKIYQKNKEYKVLGPVAISAAKQHGYRFQSGTSKRNGKIVSQGCKFVGHHWQVASKQKCKVAGFIAPKRKNKCRKLRAGWKIKNVQLKGNYVWNLRPSNTSITKFYATSNNQASAMKIVTIDYITLIGPEGKFNSFEKAFSHCSENR